MRLQRKRGFYEKYVKRLLDIVCALLALIVFSWLYLLIAVLVRIKLGSPVLFKQPRPGMIDPETGKERVFTMCKFRTMTDARDADGNLLPDEERLPAFGRMLRATSLDELPEAFNILKGDMSVVGPRPQLVRDMVFMTDEQRMRHAVRPGLTGLAQVNGRNAISWEEKINLDLKYIEKISFANDLKIVFLTFKKVFLRVNITESNDETDVNLDYGDSLLREGKVTRNRYDALQIQARNIIETGGYIGKGAVTGACILVNNDVSNATTEVGIPCRIMEQEGSNEDELVSIIMPSYNTENYISQAIDSVRAQTYKNWELLIVDDCSVDSTDEVVKPFLRDERIKYFKNEKNCGAAVCRNRALREAKGRWIAFLDSDDLWVPEKLEKQINFMVKNRIHFSYSNYCEIKIDGYRNGISVTGPKKITKKGFNNYCWPGCLTVMYDSKTVGLIQVEDIRKNNDYAMWLKVCRKADCYLLNEELAMYRRGRRGSISSHSILTMIKWHYTLFKKAEGQNSVLALINTGRNLVFGLYKKERYVRRSQ